MKNYKLLSLDESGKASYKHLSQLFILSCVVIPEEFKLKLDRLMRRLKKRYFQNDEIIFHSRDMSRKKGPFAILQDSKKEINFWSDFISILNNREISLLFIITNKQNAKEKAWQTQTILKRSYLQILEDFTTKHLGPRIGGKIIVESDPSQDLYLIQAHNRLQSIGTTDKSISANSYRTRMTSLSLVNKLNLDVDIQVADALASIAGMKYNIDILKDQKEMTKVENMKKRLIDRKMSYKLRSSVFKVIV